MTGLKMHPRQDHTASHSVVAAWVRMRSRVNQKFSNVRRRRRRVLHTRTLIAALEHKMTKSLGPFEYGSQRSTPAQRKRTSWAFDLLFPAVLGGAAYLVGITFFGF